MHFLFFFIDGIGLGPDDPESNPFARAEMPNLINLLGGHRLVKDTLDSNNGFEISERATLIELDAALDVDGYPQSASGQAAILTGINIPKTLGYHYGPKPNPEIKDLLKNKTIFHQLKDRGFRTALLNAYPQGYFDRIESGRGLPGAVAMAALQAEIPLKTTVDLIEGKAMSADFTGDGWRDHLHIADIPTLTHHNAGKRLTELSWDYDFAFFEYWISDYAGHRADMVKSCILLETFDAVLGGLLATWNDTRGLILITSDHGNLEDMNTRRHTLNAVPGLIIGPHDLRQKFAHRLVDLSGITPAILQLFE